MSGHDNTFLCGHCEQLEDRSQMTKETTREGDPICQECLREEYVGCDECGEMVFNEEAERYWECGTTDSYFDLCPNCQPVHTRMAA